MQRKGVPAEQGGWSEDADARARVEQVAMRTVMEAERALGHDVIDVSAQKCGWDVTSQPKPVGGRLTTTRHIEVRGAPRARARSRSPATKSSTA